MRFFLNGLNVMFVLIIKLNNIYYKEIIIIVNKNERILILLGYKMFFYFR